MQFRYKNQRRDFLQGCCRLCGACATGRFSLSVW
ncbi:twin-arginine translocation signal domain-containing protein [Parendozoicomonas haliclonae]